MSVRPRLTQAAEGHLRGAFLAYAKRWIAQKSDEQLITVVRSVREWSDYILSIDEGSSNG